MQHASFWDLKDGAEIQLPSHWEIFCDFVSYFKSPASVALRMRNTTSVWISGRGSGWYLGERVGSRWDITPEVSWGLFHAPQELPRAVFARWPQCYPRGRAVTAAPPLLQQVGEPQCYSPMPLVWLKSPFTTLQVFPSPLQIPQRSSLAAEPMIPSQPIF